MAKEHQVIKNRPSKRRKLESAPKPVKEGSHEEVLRFEVTNLLASRLSLKPNEESATKDDRAEKNEDAPLPEPFTELELDIVELSSTGDALAIAPSGNHVYVVPFSVPGDRVLAKALRPVHNQSYSHADFLKVIRPSPKREGVIPQCKYFSTCSGCQLQMLPYEAQLEHKRTIVEKAFRNFSGLSSEQVPKVGKTMGSPLEYGYRTKLTPHFDGPPGKRNERRFTQVPKIGFAQKGRRYVMDIEVCPIATDIVQEGLRIERANVAKNLSKYRNGATILLRESTQRIPKEQDGDSAPISVDQPVPTSKELTHDPDTGAPQLKLTYPAYTDIKTYTSNNDSTATEYISKHTFTSRAGSFFQNNNSILTPFITYVRDNCIPAAPILDPKNPDPPVKYLLDAYCGSGLFTIALSGLFSSALGIDIDAAGVASARTNAEKNNIPNAGFIAADASDLFADVPYPPDQSLVVIDPPRKGASEDFLRQLCAFGPKRVVYVSCNVHTQARDVGMLVDGFGPGPAEKWKYEIESLRGLDFFPQTGHVEGICFLNRVPAARLV